jgi:hypothetical protein
MTTSGSNAGACSNGSRGIFAGTGATNIIDYITISTTGNAADFGDLSVLGVDQAGASAFYGAA